MLGPLTGRIYVVTRYKLIDAETGTFEALEKYDVTSDFMAVKEEAERLFTYTPRSEAI
jgi:hypothetical protein